MASGFASSKFFANAHSPLPSALASFLANVLCSRNLINSGSCSKYWMSLW